MYFFFIHFYPSAKVLSVRHPENWRRLIQGYKISSMPIHVQNRPITLRSHKPKFVGSTSIGDLSIRKMDFLWNRAAFHRFGLLCCAGKFLAECGHLLAAFFKIFVRLGVLLVQFDGS